MSDTTSTTVHEHTGPVEYEWTYLYDGNVVEKAISRTPHAAIECAAEAALWAGEPAGREFAQGLTAFLGLPVTDDGALAEKVVWTTGNHTITIVPFRQTYSVKLSAKGVEKFRKAGGRA